MRILPFVALALLLVASGCARNRVEQPLSLELVRAPLTDFPRGEIHGEQRLRIDLDTGRAVLHDAHGQAHPHQLEPGDLADLRDLIADGQWRFREPAPLDINSVAALRYELWARDGEMVADKPDSLWFTPARRGEPGEAATLLIRIFDKAHRTAHPISRNVNLIP